MATIATGTTTALTATAVNQIEAGPNEAIVFTNVSLMNLDTTSRTVTFYQVASGGSASTANQCLVQSVITGQSTTVPAGAFVIANGASLWAKTDSGTSVNLSINYYTTDQQA